VTADASLVRAVLEHIDRDELVELASQLIRIPSFKTEETPVARFLHAFFGQRGYDVELQEIEPGRLQTIATLPGRGGGASLMLNGHIMRGRDSICAKSRSFLVLARGCLAPSSER
jgi:acetylornithine deacetylase